MRLEAEVERAEKLGLHIVTLADGNYPEPLSKIHDPPLALYVMGRLERGDRRAIGVVGTRHATMYGRDCAEHLSCQLAHAGFTVVSGLARGIDTAAHRAALKGKGRTIAAIGSALDHLYPAENMALAREDRRRARRRNQRISVRAPAG